MDPDHIELSVSEDTVPVRLVARICIVAVFVELLLAVMTENSVIIVIGLIMAWVVALLYAYFKERTYCIENKHHMIAERVSLFCLVLCILTALFTWVKTPQRAEGYVSVVLTVFSLLSMGCSAFIRSPLRLFENLNHEENVKHSRRLYIIAEACRFGGLFVHMLCMFYQLDAPFSNPTYLILCALVFANIGLLSFGGHLMYLIVKWGLSSLDCLLHSQRLCVDNIDLATGFHFMCFMVYLIIHMGLAVLRALDTRVDPANLNTFDATMKERPLRLANLLISLDTKVREQILGGAGGFAVVGIALFVFCSIKDHDAIGAVAVAMIFAGGFVSCMLLLIRFQVKRGVTPEPVTLAQLTLLLMAAFMGLTVFFPNVDVEGIFFIFSICFIIICSLVGQFVRFNASSAHPRPILMAALFGMSAVTAVLSVITCLELDSHGDKHRFLIRLGCFVLFVAPLVPMILPNDGIYAAVPGFIVSTCLLIFTNFYEWVHVGDTVAAFVLLTIICGRITFEKVKGMGHVGMGDVY